MILRRVISHVKNQEWTAIFLDFLIVVTGVFIGIQVSNWNAERQHENTEQLYIEHIREDLLANQDDLRQRLVYFNQTRDHGLAVLDALDSSIENREEQFLIDVYQASQILPRGMRRDTYDEILSVGANNAISNADVRRRIANFYSSISAQETTLENTTGYRELVRAHMPYAVQSAIREACNDIIVTSENGQPTISLPEECQIDLDPDVVSSAVSTLEGIELRNHLVRRLSNLDAKLLSAQLILERAQLLDAYLAEVSP